MKKHYETHVEDTDKLISVAGPVLDYKSWYEQYRKLMEEQAQRKYGLYTPTSEGDGDDFPSISGMIARYSALGLTNEQMAANPVWVDKTGNGHDIQLKNFSWKGMSGVGGYVQDFNDFRNNATVDKIRIDEQGSNSIKVTILTTGIGNAIYIPKNIYQFNKSYFIKISSEGYDEGDMALSFYAPSTSTATTVTVSLNPNGVTEIPAIKEDDFLAVYINVSGKVGSFTVEQLPLYPGFILGDGVDDFAITEEDFNFEKEFCVYLAAIFFPQDSPRNEAILGKDSNKDIRVLQYNNNLTFNSGNHTYCSVNLGQFSIVAFKRKDDTLLAKNLTTGVSNSVKATSSVLENPDKFYLWVIKGFSGYSDAAIAGSIIVNGRFTTDEDDEKILDWYKQEYPWLFPDSGWTVTGKTNEDTDRATIANITGNGNDLILSNFGFAEGSGYNEEGEYEGYLVTDGVDDKITSSIFEMGNDWTVIGDWELINTGKKDNAGIVKFDSIVIYNYNPILINIKNGRNNLIPDQNTVNAICSDGRIYSKDWKESIYNEETESTSKNLLTIGYSGNSYTKIAFKNLAIYPTVLSKEDCIKAYNYLQTLKAK